MRDVRVGQKWRSDLGGPPNVVVAVEGAMVYTKRADWPKKSLMNRAGAYLVALSEFENWRLLEDAPEVAAMREP